MNSKRFNQLIDEGRANADGNLQALERGYRIALQAAARHAGDRFAALSTDHLTADITDPKWTPPENDQLIDPAAMAADAQKRTQPARHAALKAAMGPALADIGVAYDLTNPLVAGLIDTLGVRAADMGDAVRGDVAKAVLAAYQQGLSVVDAAKNIQAAVEGIAPARAAMLARTDLVGVANAGSVAAAQLVAGSDGEGGPGFKRWLCLAGDVRVSARATRVARRAYSGDLVAVRVATGGLGDTAHAYCDLSVTPNHAILTGRGWIQAKLLEPGDRVFGCPSLDVASVVQPDVENAPPTISEVFDAAANRRAPERMMGAVVNLDGEREESEVDVVLIDGELRDRLKSHIDQTETEFLFALSDVGVESALVGGSPSKGFRGDADAHVFRVSPSSRSERILAVNDPSHLSGGGLVAVLDASEFEDLSDRLWGAAESETDLSARFSGFVAPLDVVSVEVLPWRGHVYDLETETGWFLGNSIIVHNSTEDERTRETHVEADGQVVPLNDVFTVGGEQLAFPGDPDGSDAECCNCRCTVVYLDAAEAAGDVTAAMQSPTGDVTSQGLMAESLDDTLTADVTITVGGDAVDAAAAEVRWQAVLCVEGVQTEDGRMLEAGSISWRDLPLSLGAMFETPHSYDASAEICGRIDSIWRNGNQIMGSGVFGMDEVGQRAAEMVANLSLRGISVDLGILAYELREADPPVAVDETDDTPDAGADVADVITEIDNLVFVVTDGVIGAATVCPFQAIAGATIAVVAAAGPGESRATFSHVADWQIVAAADTPPAEIDPRVAKALDALTAATKKDRFEQYRLGMEIGIYTLNDCLRAEGIATVADGDERAVPMPITKLAQLSEKLSSFEATAHGMTVLLEQTRQHEQNTQALVASITDLTEKVAAGERVDLAMIETLRAMASRPQGGITVIRDEAGRVIEYKREET